MTLFFSNAANKTVSAFIANKVSPIIAIRRGYAAAAASQGGLSDNIRSGVPRVMLKKQGSEEKSWGPDPVTGYYRPENKVKEIDAAELREMLLKIKNKTTPN